MMRSIIVLLLTLAFISNSRNVSGQEQEHSFRKNDNIISAGYGFGTLYSAVAYGFAQAELDNRIGGIKLDTNAISGNITGPVYIKYEKALSNWIGLGGEFAWFNSNADFAYRNNNGETRSLKVNYSTFSILARLNIHLAQRSKYLDPYIGFGLGLRNYKYRFSLPLPYHEENLKSSVLFLGMDATFGMRAYITPDIGLFGEIGFAKSVLQVGACAKF